MIAQKQGSIVNVVSIQAMEGMMTSVAYTATKAALLGYTMSVSFDYGLHNIRVNSLAQDRFKPGSRQTQAIRIIDGNVIKQPWQGGHCSRRWAALFLASDEASFVTGATIPVDGGWTSSAARKRE